MKAWNDLEVTLYKIHEGAVTDEEKALGIFGRKLGQGVVLRNWLTFILRQSISDTFHHAIVSKQLKRIFENYSKTSYFMPLIVVQIRINRTFLTRYQLISLLCVTGPTGVCAGLRIICSFQTRLVLLKDHFWQVCYRFRVKDFINSGVVVVSLGTTR